MAIGNVFAGWGAALQRSLFPEIEEASGPMGPNHMELALVIDHARVGRLLPYPHGGMGRPPHDRASIAKAFLAKSVFNLPTTRSLIDRLNFDVVLRRMCGFEKRSSIPDETIFSRAFAEFAASDLMGRIHADIVTRGLEGRTMGHVSIDSTAIEARERPDPGSRKGKEAEKTEKERRKDGGDDGKGGGTPPKKRGRPKAGEVRTKEPTALSKQLGLALRTILESLPKKASSGAKRGSRGQPSWWFGYKLHVASADGGIPVACILTSASVHDSQAAIPLSKMAAERMSNLYDLMDAAYDAPEIRAHSLSLGHVPIIDGNPRSDAEKKQEKKARETLAAMGFSYAEEERYKERTNSERVNSDLKDNHGGRTLLVKGPEKAFCHLMTGMVAVTVKHLSGLLSFASPRPFAPPA